MVIKDKFIAATLMLISLWVAGNSFIFKKAIALDSKMILIEEGDFKMGINNILNDMEPEHVVHLKSYYIDKFEVNNNEYIECVEAGACTKVKPQTRIRTVDEYMDILRKNYSIAVSGVTWEQANMFCRWKEKRLPTEAEWEKAARGPNGNLHSWGNTSLNEGFAGVYTGQSAPPASYTKDKSHYGVYDMEGNVSEWVSDWYSDNYYKVSPKQNPQGPETGKEKVVRGGNWYDKINPGQDENPYIMFRRNIEPHLRKLTIGFRCAKDSN